MINTVKLYSKQYNNLTKEFFSKYVIGNECENVVISPLSIIVLLSIAAESTDGNTRKEIAKILSGRLPYDSAIATISRIQEELSKGGSLVSSNAAIINKKIEKTLNPGYKEKLKARYDGELFCTEHVVKDINDWVTRKTNGLIEEIANDSMTNTLLALINAVAFEAEWEEDYDEYMIHEGEFTNAIGSKTMVNMLDSSEELYVENSDFTGFIKPYKNGEYSFMGLLPKNPRNVRVLRRSTENIDFSKIFSSAKNTKVFVSMPEFKGEFSTELTDLFKSMGIQSVFSDTADFSPVSSEWLSAESVIHKAKIEVDRHGTKAAAVTSMFVCAGCAPKEPPKVVRLDRPFIYAIMHNETTLPAFTGITNNIK